MHELFLTTERIERTALAELHMAASATTREQLGLRLETVGSALVSIAAAEPTNILLNRTIGLDVEASATQDAVKTVVGLYAQAGVTDYFVHLHPHSQPAELRDWLTQAGLFRTRGWMKFKRDKAPPPQLQSDLEVRRIDPTQAEAFGRIAAQSFDLGEASVPLLAALVHRPDWYLFMSFNGDTPAGTGALFIQDSVAWTDWGATDPAFRRRGGQGVVLCRRIQEAIDRGCELILTTTGEAVEGDPQHSYKNILKCGFKEGYLRENYSPF